MKKLRYLLITCLTWSLVFIPEVFAQIKFSPSLKVDVKAYNDKVIDLDSFLTLAEKYSKPMASEMRDLLKKESISNDVKIPRVTYQSDTSILIEAGKEKFYFSPAENDGMIVKYKDKSVSISQKMSVFEVRNEIAKLGSTEVSLLNFFVPTASAMGFEIFIFALITLVTVLIMAGSHLNHIHDRENRPQVEAARAKFINDAKINCEKFKASGKALTLAQEDVIRKTMEAASSQGIDGSTLGSPGWDLFNCLNGLLDGSSLVDNSSRNTKQKESAQGSSANRRPADNKNAGR